MFLEPQDQALLMLHGFDRGVVSPTELAQFIEEAVVDAKLVQANPPAETRVATEQPAPQFKPWLGYANIAVGHQEISQKALAEAKQAQYFQFKTDPDVLAQPDAAVHEKRYTPTEFLRREELLRRKNDIRATLRNINDELEGLGRW